MPNTFYKGTMYFSQGIQGWSESWWLSFNAQQSDLAPLLTKLENLAVARRLMLCSDAQISHLSVREVMSNTKRRVMLERYAQTGSITEIGADADGAALLRFTDLGAFHFTLRPMRGVPQSQYQSNIPNFKITDPYNKGMTAFQKQLTKDSWGWLYQGTPTSQNITAVAGGAGMPVQITTTGTPFATLGVGTHVRGRIKSVEGATQLNGAFVGKVLSANSFSVPRITAFGPYSAATGIVVLPGAPTLATPTDYEIEGFDERKTGRPFFQQRGRRLARRSL